MIADGCTAEEIAAELGRPSKSAVYKAIKRRKFKIPSKRDVPRKPEIMSMVLGMLDRGCTVPHIAEVRQVSRQAVAEMVARLTSMGLVECVGYTSVPRYTKGWRAKLYKTTRLWKSRDGHGGSPEDFESWQDNLQEPRTDMPTPQTHTEFVINPGDEVRLATDHHISNGKLGRVVSVHEWGAILETNWQRPNNKDGTAGRLYRAAWHEMEPVGKTELVDPHTANGNGHHRAGGGRTPKFMSGTRTVGKTHKSPPTTGRKPEITGNACPQCHGVFMVRTGACVTCQDCGYNEGCG